MYAQTVNHSDSPCKPQSLQGFHRGFQKGFHFQNESCDCIKYLNLGEFLITIMSSLSQEESRSISENVRRGIKKRMSDGKYSVTYSHFIGFDRGADGKMVINENEANIVRFIFRSPPGLFRHDDNKQADGAWRSCTLWR